MCEKSRPKRGSKKARLAASRGWPGARSVSCTAPGASAAAVSAAPAAFGRTVLPSSSSQAAHLRLSWGGAEASERAGSGMRIT